MPDRHWRLIDTDKAHPYFVTALDEVLAHSRSKGLAPDTLHFYRRSPPGVSVGYFKKVEDDVDLAQCKKYGVVIVRRTSGGGTIYTDEGQLIYGMATGSLLADGIEATFKVICDVIIAALSSFNIKAEYKPPNDIVMNGRKISGNAQTHKGGAILQHGTIILRTRPEMIEKILRTRKAGYVSSIEEECGRVVDIVELKAALVKELEKRLSIELEPAKPSPDELGSVQNLIDTKYGTREWNFKR